MLYHLKKKKSLVFVAEDIFSIFTTVEHAKNGNFLQDLLSPALLFSAYCLKILIMTASVPR